MRCRKGQKIGVFREGNYGQRTCRALNLEDGMHQQLLPLAVRGLWRGRGRCRCRPMSNIFNVSQVNQVNQVNLTLGTCSTSRQSKPLTLWTGTAGPLLRPSLSSRFTRPALVAIQFVRFCSYLSQQSLNMASDRDVLPDTYAMDTPKIGALDTNCFSELSLSTMTFPSMTSSFWATGAIREPSG
jgi:hypothetical protein